MKNAENQGNLSCPQRDTMDTICVSRRSLSRTRKAMNKRSCCYKKAQANPLV